MLSFYLTGLKKIFGLAKKVLLVVTVFFIVISLFVYFINKDRPKITYDPIKKNREEIYKVINDPKLSKTKEGRLSIALYRAMMCGMIGETCTSNPQDSDKNFDKSLFGLLSKLIATPFVNPAASGTLWAYAGLQNTGFIPRTYAAAGIGFGSIQPLSQVWTAMRDIAYLILVLVIITIGFMIMFRMKLNPQTVISMENALPKIVISLILITFSYPIAGFLIDLMYIVIAIIISVLGPSAGYTPDVINQKQQYFMAAGPWQLFEAITLNKFAAWDILWDLPNALLNLVPLIGATIKYVGVGVGIYFFYPWLFYHFFGPVIGFAASVIPEDISVSAVIASMTFDLKNLLEQGFSGILRIIALILSIVLAANVIIPVLLGLLILLTVIFIFFRLLFILFSAYIKLLVFIAISPLYLLFEAIPGQSAFTGWLKNLLSQLIIFPIIIALILFSIIIMNNATAGNLIQPPFLFGIDSKSFGLILGMFFLFLIPDMVKIAQQFIIPKPGPLEGVGGLGIFFGGVTTGVSTGFGEVSKWATTAHYVKPFGDIIRKLPFGETILGKTQR